MDKQDFPIFFLAASAAAVAEPAAAAAFDACLGSFAGVVFNELGIFTDDPEGLLPTWRTKSMWRTRNRLLCNTGAEHSESVGASWAVHAKYSLQIGANRNRIIFC